jgi:pimeloyl-ACP methyl ester carboxylesterase
LNGVGLAYEVRGSGEAVLLIMGSGAKARVWHRYQVPALTAAGYKVVTFDNRGTPPSATPPGPYTIELLVADTIALIEHLELAPCRIGGLSLGSFIAQELALARPDLVRALGLIATRGRLDTTRKALAEAEILKAQRGIKLPAEYTAIVQALQVLSPQTLNDDSQMSLWLDMFALFPVEDDELTTKLRLDLLPNRLHALRNVRVPSLVIGFQDDLITPPALSREVAEAIPGCAYVEVPGCGHLGHLERPDAVNAALIDFFARV